MRPERWKTTVTSAAVLGKTTSSRARVASSESSARATSSVSADSWRARNDDVTVSTQAMVSHPRRRRSGAAAGCISDEDRSAVARDDPGDFLGGTLELVVGEHRCALEREVARDFQPGAAAAELVAHLHGDRARDAVGAQQHDVQRMTALPRQPLLGVVARPHVERRQGVDHAGIGDRPVVGDLRPRTDAHAVGLRDLAIAPERMQRRVALGPDALLERAQQLWLMRLAHEVLALVVERRVQEEALVLEREVLVRLANAALAQRDQLLAFSERTYGDGPFFESNRHWIPEGRRCVLTVVTAARQQPRTG